MKIIYPSGVRVNWYDRNPVVKIGAYGPTTVGPHAFTERLTYTVTNGKRAWLSMIQGELTRITVAAPLGDAHIQFYANIGGGNIYVVHRLLMLNTVGATNNFIVGEMGMLPAGTVIGFYSGDFSTGGTITYSFGYQIIEFDA